MTGLLLEPQPGTIPANNPMQWAALALGVVTILYFVVIRPLRKGKPRSDPLAFKPTKSSLAQQRAIERDMGNLLVQYEEMIRRMTAQVDTRATKLELLIREAEGKIAELKRLSSAANLAGPSSDSTGSTASTSSPQASSPQASSTPAEQTLDSNPGANPVAVADGGPTAQTQTATSPPTAVEAPNSSNGAAGMAWDVRKAADELGPAGVDDRHADIYRLADGGRSARQIAQELDRPYGEVELILHLRSPRPRQGDLWDQPAAAPVDAPAQAEAFDPPEPPGPGPGESRRKGRKKQRSSGG